MNYVGMKCPVCGKAFTADDDIVVCPQCGAPYHRECYAHAGKCIYEDRHGTPYAWKPPQPDIEEETQRCPRCGAKNLKSALYCVHCGMPLSESEQQPRNNPFPSQSQNPWNRQNGADIPPQGGNVPPNFGYQGQPFFFLVDPLGGVNPAESVDGVPAGDIAKFVQENTQYYVPVFSNIGRFGKSRFNFSAFFFQGIWMLFRKLYRIGAIIAAVQGAMFFTYLLLMKYAVLPLYEKLYSLAGVTSGIYGYTITNTQRDELARQIIALPAGQRFLAAVPGLYLIGSIILMIVCGAIGNRVYMRNSISRIRQIHSEASEPAEFAARLQQEGGVNTSAAALFTCCLMVIYFLALL